MTNFCKRSNEALRLQVIESLGKIDPGNPLVICSLEEILKSTQQDTIRRRAAYSLGKIDPEHPKVIAVLEQIISSTMDSTLRLQTAENLIMIDPENAVAIIVLESTQKKLEKISKRHQTKVTQKPNLAQFIAALEQRLVTAKDATNQRRIAFRLGTLQPGHHQAINCLLQLLLSQESPALHKRVVEDLKEVLLDHQLTEVVSCLKRLAADSVLSISTQDNVMQLYECHKLLWYCAQRMSYANFSNAWCN